MKKNNTRILFWIIFMMSSFLLLAYNSWGVLETSEARYAEIAREMLRSGDFLHPRLLGILHYHKPPLTYILSTISLGLFGVNSLGARFFLLIAFITQIIFVYKISRLIFGGYIKPLNAAIIYSGLPLVIISVLNLTTDAFLNSFELIAIYFIIRFYKEKKLIHLKWFYVFLSLTFLTKGPVGLIFPLMMMGAFRIIYGRVLIKGKFKVLGAFSIFLLISLPWFIYLIIENKDLLNYFVFKHTVDRVSDASSFERSEPIYYYIVLFPLLFIPWAILFIKKTFERNIWKKLSSWKNILLFWIIIPVLLFSMISSKLVFYILPIAPGLAIICGWMLDEMKGTELRLWTKIHLIIYILLSSALIIFPLVINNNVTTSLMIIVPLLIIISLIFVHFSAKAFKIHKILIYSLIFGSGLILFSSAYVSKNELYLNGIKPLVKYIEKSDLDNHQLIVYDTRLPSISFMFDRDIISLHDGGKSLNREIQFEKDDSWKNQLIKVEESNKDSILNILLQKESVLLCKNEPTDRILWISRAFNYKKNIGPWTIFYNK